MSTHSPAAAVDDLSEWRSFFDKAADFVEGIERLYGVANELFTEYAIDRLSSLAVPFLTASSPPQPSP